MNATAQVGTNQAGHSLDLPKYEEPRSWHSDYISSRYLHQFTLLEFLRILFPEASASEFRIISVDELFYFCTPRPVTAEEKEGLYERQ
ncbi:unnamed protein product [Discula destructiva]